MNTKIELRCLGCGEPLDVMPTMLHDGSVFFQLVSPCNKCIDEELKFFRSSFPRAAANYFKVSSQQMREPDDSLGIFLHCMTCGNWHREKESCIPANRSLG